MFLCKLQYLILSLPNITRNTSLYKPKDSTVHFQIGLQILVRDLQSDRAKASREIWGHKVHIGVRLIVLM